MKDRRVKDGRVLYHVELRQFPHDTHVYNVDAERLQRELIGPWVRGEIFAFGEQEWIPNRSNISILEGPHLPLGQLGLGKGWSNASRVSEDVTERCSMPGEQRSACRDRHRRRRRFSCARSAWAAQPSR